MHAFGSSVEVKYYETPHFSFNLWKGRVLTAQKGCRLISLFYSLRLIGGMRDYFENDPMLDGKEVE